MPVTLHYIRSFSLDGNSAEGPWRKGAEAKLARPLGEASTSDLMELLQERLGNTSVPNPHAVASTTDIPPGERANAVLVMLVRNSEVNDAAGAIQQLEDRFNRKFKYPWVFLNDEPFDERFIQCVIPLLSFLRPRCAHFGSCMANSGVSLFRRGYRGMQTRI